MTVSFPEPKFLQTNGIRIAYDEMGQGMPVVLCHGFPELAFSWHRVMPLLADAGYRAITGTGGRHRRASGRIGDR